MSARWEEALDAQLDLYLFNGSPRGRGYAERWAASFRGRGGSLKAELADRLPERIGAVALNADPFYVDPDMQTLWEAAVPGFAAEPLHPQDLLAQTGFVYLPRPFRWIDTHGKATSFRAFAWHETTFNGIDPATGREQTGHGVVILTFHRIGDRDDYDSGTGVPLGDDPDDQRRRAAGPDGIIPWALVSQRVGDLTVDHVMPWEYGATDEAIDGRAVLTGQALPDYRLDARHPANVQRPIQCLWRLMQQTIFARNPIEPTRPVRRRLQRAEFPARRVTVIRLRRPSGGTAGEPGQVEWSHRWLVSGHWRWQPYGDGIRRQIWISPYVKGPADKPLDVRRVRVFEFVR